jgi:hypothetical protein
VITPRLFRRSLAAGAQWRPLFLFWLSLLLPTLLATLPVLGFFSALLATSPRAQQVVAWLDGNTLLELLRQAGDPQFGAALPGGYLAGLLVLLATAPAVSGAMVAAARSDEPLRLRPLLGAAGELFGRMVRLALVGAVPLGIGGAIAAGAFKLAENAGEKAILATQAGRQFAAATVVSALVLWLAHLTLDAGRAVLSAEPQRRSAFLAWTAGVRLIARLPVRALAVGLLGSVAGFGVAAGLMLLRLRLEQSTAARVGMAWALAQVAVVAVGWGKAVRISGLAELARADAAERLRKRAFQMSPPATSPPPPAGSPAAPALAPVDALPAGPLLVEEPPLEAVADAAPPALSPPDPSDS